MSTLGHPIHVLAGQFVMIDQETGKKTFSHTDRQEDDLFYDLVDMFKTAISNVNLATLRDPDMCTLGMDNSGSLYRFYWYSGLSVGGKDCGFGANLHTKTAIGSMWLMSNPKLGKNTPELHPWKRPVIPKKTDWQSHLATLVTNGTFERLKKK